MTNNERAKFLLQEAKENFKEMKDAFSKGLYNRTIRRAQEVVEQSLKAVIKLMNFEYPKEHDVAKNFEEILKKRGISYEDEEIKKIKEISANLEQRRAPAFYGEVFYTKDEAISAMEGAEFVLNFVLNLMERLN